MDKQKVPREFRGQYIKLPPINILSGITVSAPATARLGEIPGTPYLIVNNVRKVTAVS